MTLMLSLFLSITLISSVYTHATASNADVVGTSVGQPRKDTRSEAFLTLTQAIGGPGGDPWDDLVNINGTARDAKIRHTPHRRIWQVRASCGDRPDSLQVVYRDTTFKVGNMLEVNKDGAVHGTESQDDSHNKLLLLDTQEVITKVWLETCQVKYIAKKRHRICFLKIETTRQFGESAFTCGVSTWKDQKGKPLPATWSGNQTSALFAFAGRSGDGIDQLSSWWGTREAYGV